MAIVFDNGPFDPDANVGPAMVRVCVAMMFVSGIGLFGRFLARRLMKQPILWDDWMIVLAVPFAWGCCIIQIIGVYTAFFGRHAHFATPESTIQYFKQLYALQIVYPIAIFCIKISIILFYRRIFSISQTFKPLLLLGLIVSAWSVATVLVAVFDCIPIHAFWDFQTPRTCIDSLHYFLGIAIPNVVTDVALLVLPIPWIWKLVISRSQKIALSGIFILGGFVTVISTLRMVTLIQTQGQLDFTWSLIPLATWNVVETNVGVLLACLPSMRPLLRILLRQGLVTKGSEGGASSKEMSSNRWGGRSVGHSRYVADNSFLRLNNTPSLDDATMYGHEISVTTGNPGKKMEL